MKVISIVPRILNNRIYGDYKAKKVPSQDVYAAQWLSAFNDRLRTHLKDHYRFGWIVGTHK